MRLKITVTDEQGQVFEGEADLIKKDNSQAANPAVKKTKPTPATTRQEVDFDLPLRPFVRKYARELSGPKKFALLVAHTAKGQTQTEVESKEVEKKWNKMTALLSGKFNRFYSQTARDNGWVDSLERGKYRLRANWTEVLN